MLRHPTVAIACVIASAIALPTRALASDPTNVDGVYGRFRADTAISLEAGGGVGVVSSGARGAFDANVRMRYLDMTGIFVGFDSAPGSTRMDALSVGVDFRPLMLARIFSDWEHGPRWVDLVADSVGLDMGVAVMNLGGQWRSDSGLAYVLGGGAELPLVWHAGTALMLRVSVRWIHAAGWDAEASATGDMVLVTAAIVGRTMARLGLVGSP